MVSVSFGWLRELEKVLERLQDDAPTVVPWGFFFFNSWSAFFWLLSLIRHFPLMGQGYIRICTNYYILYIYVLYNIYVLMYLRWNPLHISYPLSIPMPKYHQTSSPPTKKAPIIFQLPPKCFFLKHHFTMNQTQPLERPNWLATVTDEGRLLGWGGVAAPKAIV